MLHHALYSLVFSVSYFQLLAQAAVHSQKDVQPTFNFLQVYRLEPHRFFHHRACIHKFLKDGLEQEISTFQAADDHPHLSIHDQWDPNHLHRYLLTKF